MYEMLVGEVPIKADNYNQRVMIGDFARPRSKRPEIPPPLEDLILRAMALPSKSTTTTTVGAKAYAFGVVSLPLAEHSVGAERSPA